MCLTVPSQVVRVEGNVAWVDADGGERPILLGSLDGVRPGDYLLHHAGLALEQVEPAEAAAILSIFAEMAASDEMDPRALSKERPEAVSAHGVDGVNGERR